MKKSDFFVGWSNDMPKSSAKAIRLLLIPLCILIPLIIFTLIYYEKPFNDHQFELGKQREFVGVYFDNPKPILILDNGYYPKNYHPSALLVGYGKFGASSSISKIEKTWGSLSNKRVKLKGTLLYGDGRIVIELTEGENSVLEVLESEAKISSNSSIEVEATYEGEIIDPKCWFGAMKPGEGKVHKSCAIRCISGGIPPILRIKQQEEYTYHILQSSTSEDINTSVLEYVGEPVTIHGEAYSQNGWNVLKTTAKEIHYTNN